MNCMQRNAGQAPNPEHLAAWVEQLTRQMPELPLRLANQHRPDHAATQVSHLSTGSSALHCLVTFEDGACVMIRFPMPSSTNGTLEKTSNEVSVMRYLARTTIIPVPSVLGAGTWDLGLYVITEFVDGDLLSHRLHMGLEPDTSVPIPIPTAIPDPELERAYHCMAHVILELSKTTFPSIGTLVQTSDAKWTIQSTTPMTLQSVSTLYANVDPPTLLPSKPFTTANAYFVDLATQHLHHLFHQRNAGLLTDTTVWKEKYIARCLFRRIARSIKTEPGPFRLYSDDFSPANVLVLPNNPAPTDADTATVTATAADFSVTAVTNWSGTYAAPNEFTYTAPWWLLFQSAAGWEEDMSRFMRKQTPHLDMFLSVLRAVEDDQIAAGVLDVPSGRLSSRMAESLHNGLFWFCLAARKSHIFDDIFWAFLDERWFGPLGSLDERLALLSEADMEEFDESVRAEHRKAKFIMIHYIEIGYPQHTDT
ncbi:hypothetical protein BDW74DRAFT_168345 [Aspergillus multicolor]|uniref:uncharacterized protein n=1 Tax=Aspergillus multicolor TaxID=41759 RepID=UPI003CCCC76B